MAVASGGRSVPGLNPLGPGVEREAWSERTVASGQWSVASECKAGGLAVTEKRQNEANLLGC
jgi:hypothetical protein